MSHNKDIEKLYSIKLVLKHLRLILQNKKKQFFSLYSNMISLLI